MKRSLAMLLALMLLPCLAGCAKKEPPIPIVDDGLLNMEELTGSYDVAVQGEKGNESRTVDLRILNDRLTFALYPNMSLDSENSFDSYDPKTGEAVLQREMQDENGAFTVSCALHFSETDGKITASGHYTITRENAAEESYTLFCTMIDKL